MREGNKIRFSVAGTCCEMEIEHPEIQKRVRSFYRKYISRIQPDIYITVKHRHCVEPDFNSLIVKASRFCIGVDKQRNDLSIYFPGDQSSLATISKDLRKIEFVTASHFGRVLLYLFPQLLFGLILPHINALLLHACGVIDKKRGYLFVAESGGGKSTMAKLSLKEKFTLLNDDRIIIRKQGDVFTMYGTPWHGEVKQSSNKSIPIKSIYFLKKFPYNIIIPMNKTMALTELLRNIFYLPIDNAAQRHVFHMSHEIVENFNCYQLGFKPDRSIWSILHELPE